MTIPLILATMFAVGVIGFALWAIAFIFMEADNLLITIAAFLTGLPIACLLAFIPFAMIADAESPILVSLRKGEWECTASHRVFVGKTLVTKCDQYNRSVK
jgi:hypothetical protein